MSDLEKTETKTKTVTDSTSDDAEVSTYIDASAEKSYGKSSINSNLIEFC
jgi:hypothetical protein